MRLKLTCLRAKLARSIAFHLPRRVAYWATVRVGAHATTGKWAQQVVPELTVADALRRWEVRP